jgi:hypothetical protein
MTRCNELDAVRGILLLLMALTHLPTGLNPYADQPLGFVSAAEGFVFLSAFLVGSIYSRQLVERGIETVRSRLWKRARRLYGYHLGLVLFAFTVVAAIAHFGHSQALHNFLMVFFRAPGWATLSAPFLLYQPPLMDILPMYIVFLALTPLLLQFVARRGWWPLLTMSLLLWVAAQLHIGRWLSGTLVSSGYPLPREAWSSFDWFAWQLVWVAGLWLGSGRRSLSLSSAPQRTAAAAPTRPSIAMAAALAAPIAGTAGPTTPTRARAAWWRRGSTYALLAAIGVATVLLFARHHIGGFLADLDVNAPVVNKWRLGPLRLANFALLGFIVHRLLLPALRWLRIAGLELLGRSSLQVFTSHIPICILADGLIDAAPSATLSIPQQTVLLALMLGVMWVVAWRSDAPRRAALVRNEQLRRAARVEALSALAPD